MDTKIDLNAILAIVDGYDARMKIVREYFDRREPVPEQYKQYLAPLEDEDVVKVFETLRPLVARVRELERQRDWLATFIDDNMECERLYWFSMVNRIKCELVIWDHHTMTPLERRLHKAGLI